MVETGHYAGSEARARAYSVLEAATALHETCDTRTALLQQSALFFRLANAVRESCLKSIYINIEIFCKLIRLEFYLF